MERVKVGIKGEAKVQVNETNTAIAYGSGGVAVFATPAMIGLMEKAALESIDNVLSAGLSSVGTRVDVKHLAATPAGMSVVAKSELLEVDGKRLEFKVEAYDESGLIGEGTHQRYIVDLEKFISKAQAKK
ncbi:MAG: thioesterase family protein [Clostridia bacterium]|nr:thioesterase family protein [Clostridia bacterium]